MPWVQQPSSSLSCPCPGCDGLGGQLSAEGRGRFSMTLPPLRQCNTPGPRAPGQLEMRPRAGQSGRLGKASGLTCCPPIAGCKRNLGPPGKRQGCSEPLQPHPCPLQPHCVAVGCMPMSVPVASCACLSLERCREGDGARLQPGAPACCCRRRAAGELLQRGSPRLPMQQWGEGGTPVLSPLHLHSVSLALLCCTMGSASAAVNTALAPRPPPRKGRAQRWGELMPGSHCHHSPGDTTSTYMSACDVCMGLHAAVCVVCMGMHIGVGA